MRGLLAPSLIAVAARGQGLALFRKVPPPPPVQTSLIASIYGQWFRLSSLVRFFVSGNLGNICFFFIERFLYQFISTLDRIPEAVESHKDTISFFAGYLLQIVSQHFLHALLVYGMHTINTRQKYFKTLVCQFYAYGIALFGSTFLNLFLIQSGLDKTMAFFSTMIIFATINYYLIGFLTRRALEKAEPEPEPKGRPLQWRPGSNHRGSTNDRPGRTKGTSQTKAVRMIRRGGSFETVHARSPFLGPSSVHQMVLSFECVDVDAVNDTE
jgi:hypothetical protein